MPFRLRIVLLLVAAAVAALPSARSAHATIIGDARIPYSATRTVVVDRKTYTGKVFHTPGHQRHDVDIGGIPMSFILDFDGSKGAVVLPALSSFIDFPLPFLLIELYQNRLGGKAVGEELIDGISATKYRLDYTARDGARGEGFIWVSRDNILLRIEGRVLIPGRRPMEIAMVLSNVKRGPQDPDLFEVPKGLHRIPPEALEALFNLGAKLKHRGN
jgi:hypothetical protein